ncbi:hypothetical protein [Streptomyces sp. NPDC048636]|uniref:hypothetical protein n=1 Tax=Streptomyces sp. NPDC048636 TaxID=3155762 RepID=UPI00344A89CD
MGDVIDLPGAAEPTAEWSPPEDPRDAPWWNTSEGETPDALVLAPPEPDSASGAVPDTFRSTLASEVPESTGFSEVTALALALATATGIEALRSLGSVSAAAMERAAHWRKQRQGLASPGAQKGSPRTVQNKAPSATGSGSAAGPGRGGKGGGRTPEASGNAGKGRTPAGPHHKPGRDDGRRHKASTDGAGKAGKDVRSGKVDKPGKSGGSGTDGKRPTHRHETARDGLPPKSPKKPSAGKETGAGPGRGGGGDASKSGKKPKGSGGGSPPKAKDGPKASAADGSSKSTKSRGGAGNDRSADRHETARDGLPPKGTKRGGTDGVGAAKAPDAPPGTDGTSKPTDGPQGGSDDSSGSTPWSAAWERWKKRNKRRTDSRDDMNDSGATADEPPAAPGGATPGGAPGGEGATWRTDGWRTTAYDGVTYTVERDDQPPGASGQPGDPAQALTTGQAALTTGQAALTAAPHRNPGTVQRPGTRRPRPMPGGTMTDLVTRGGADAALPQGQSTEISASEAVRVFADMAAEMVSDYDDTVELSRRLSRLASSIDTFIDTLAEHNICGRSMERAYELFDDVHSLARSGEEFSKSVMDGYEEALDTEAYLEDHYIPVVDATADQGLTTPSTRAHNQGD